MTSHRPGTDPRGNGRERIGVYVCHCGSNIAGTVDVAEVREWVEECALQAGFDHETIQDIKLAANEACANIIDHAYKLEKGNNIYLEIRDDEERFVLSARDDAPCFDASTFQSKTEKGLRGRGIMLMRRLMDEVQYLTHPPQGNEVRLVKLKELPKKRE